VGWVWVLFKGGWGGGRGKGSGQRAAGNGGLYRGAKQKRQKRGLNEAMSRKGGVGGGVFAQNYAPLTTGRGSVGPEAHADTGGTDPESIREVGDSAQEEGKWVPARSARRHASIEATSAA
jgi:hypothetical protein